MGWTTDNPRSYCVTRSCLNSQESRRKLLGGLAERYKAVPCFPENEPAEDLASLSIWRLSSLQPSTVIQTDMCCEFRGPVHPTGYCVSGARAS
jgi:hypothetical protein